jgi:hypothetical protein
MSNASEHGAGDAARALTAAEAVLVRVRAASAPEDPEALGVWEAGRRELEQAIAISGRALEAALRSARAGELGELELRLAALVRGLAALRSPASFGVVALEAEITAALAAPRVGGAHDGNAHKEAAVDALLHRLSVADSRALVARLERRAAGDALVAGWEALTAERRERLLQTLRGAARREVQAGEAARRAAGAALRVAAEHAGAGTQDEP